MMPTVKSGRVLKMGRCIIAERQFHGHGREFNLALLRLREIERLIGSRHGHVVPDPTGTDDEELCVAYIRAVAMSASAQPLSDWCQRWAPWVSVQLIVEVELEAAGRKRMLRADAAAALLRLTMEERKKLGIKTIGACDISKAEREKVSADQKRAADRERIALKRRASGVKSRASDREQSLEKTQPWKAEGISRATWYRRRETRVSRIDIYMKRDTSVSTHHSHDKDRTDAVRTVGFGDESPIGGVERGETPFGVSTGVCHAAP